jgi:hypothetical protein
MTTDEHIRLFVQQAAWLEHEYDKAVKMRNLGWKRRNEIRMRNAQLTREFLKFMEAHKQ